MSAEGTRKKARTLKAGGESLILAVLASTPSTKDAVATAVAGWQERWDDGFHDEVKAMVASHYPSDSKTLFDDVLAAFLFAEPEYCSSLLAPLIDALLSKRLSFSLRNAPFHSLQFAFTEAQAPGRGRTGRVFCNEILFLLAPHAQAPGPCAWLTDSLVDATPALRESFFASFLLGAQPGRLRSLVAILEEERRRFRSVNLSHAMAPALLARLDKERNGSAVLEEFSAFLQLYFSPTQDSAQHTFHTHKLVLSLTTASSTEHKQANGVATVSPARSLSSASSAALTAFSPQFLLWLVAFLAASQPPPSGWFAVHFLPPTLQAIHNGIGAALEFLRAVLAHPLHSCYLLGPSSNRIASLQAGRSSERGGEVPALLSACSAAGPAVGACVLDLWQSIWDSTESWADDWERVQALLIAYATLSAEMRTAVVRLFSAFLARARKSSAPPDLHKKILWLILAEPRPNNGDLFGAVMFHAAALSPEARTTLEKEAAECVGAVAAFELPQTVSFVVRSPSATPFACKHLLGLLNRALLQQSANSSSAVAIVQLAAPALFAALRTKDPETRHAAAQLLFTLITIAPSTSTSAFFVSINVSALLSALRDDFSFVADSALALVQRLTAFEAFARPALPQAWSLLLQSGSDSALAMRLIGVLESLVSLWHATVLNDLLHRIDAQLFASSSSSLSFVPSPASSSLRPTAVNACVVSHPNTHMLLLLERLCRFPAVRSAPEMNTLINRAVSSLGHYRDYVTIHQLKLLAACSNPTLASAMDPNMLASVRPALVRSVTSTDSTLRELALLLLCWQLDSTPAETRASSCLQLTTHMRTLAHNASPHDAALLLSAASLLQSRQQ